MCVLIRIHSIRVQDASELDLGLDCSILLRVSVSFFLPLLSASSLATIALTWKIHCVGTTSQYNIHQKY